MIPTSLNARLTARPNLLALMAAVLIGGFAYSFVPTSGDAGDSDLLDRMTIDATSVNRVTLFLDWSDREEDAFLYQFSTIAGDVLTSGRWEITPGFNTLHVEADEWPVGHLVLSVLTKKSLARKVFKRFPPAQAPAPESGNGSVTEPVQPTATQTHELGGADSPKNQGSELAPY